MCFWYRSRDYRRKQTSAVAKPTSSTGIFFAPHGCRNGMYGMQAGVIDQRLNDTANIFDLPYRMRNAQMDTNLGNVVSMFCQPLHSMAEHLKISGKILCEF